MAEVLASSTGTSTKLNVVKLIAFDSCFTRKDMHLIVVYCYIQVFETLGEVFTEYASPSRVSRTPNKPKPKVDRPR